MKTTLNAVIIDDEPVCIDNLHYHLSSYCPGINILATGNDLHDIENIFSSYRFDIAFLDIELFDRNIFDILPQMQKPHPFGIVFVTAYDSYAIKAIRADALDYILKPLSRTDIEACYGRILQRHIPAIEAVNIPVQLPETAAVKKIILKQGDQVYIARYADILYMKAMGAYTEVAFEQNGKKKTVIVSKTINTMEKECSSTDFRRVHKSFVVNTASITSIARKGQLQLTLKSDDIIPVAKRRAGEFITSYHNTGT